MFINVLINNINGANILNLLGCASPSHHLWNSVLINSLAAKGNNMTVLSVNVDENPPKNVHYILLEGVYEYVYKDSKMDLLELAEENIVKSLISFYDFFEYSCIGILKSKGIQTLLNYPNDFQFDLILYDYTSGPCLLGFKHRYNVPIIGITAYNKPPYTKSIIGGHHYFSYIPHYSLGYEMNMNIWQRMANVFMTMFDELYYNLIFVPNIDKLIRNMFNNTIPYIGELEQQTILTLTNTNPIIDYPEPLPPNVIQVGGLQIKPNKSLSKDLEEFINAGSDGAILFSLGTNIRSDTLDKEKQLLFIKAFAEMPNINFLWKFESETLPTSIPKNVLIRKWLPQNDILAHPNVKCFITHSGLLSTQEAAWYGKPMIGLPFFMDQYRNLYRSMKLGIAEKLIFRTLTVEEIKDKVKMVLYNPRYKERAQYISRNFKDQPEKPINRAIWWIEYILRNNNPDHLKLPTQLLGILQTTLIDILLIFTTILFLIFLIIRKIRKMCIKQKFTSNIKKNN